jgi:hypothetical protein
MMVFYKLNLALEMYNIKLVNPGLDYRFTDGSKVVSPTHWPHFTPKKHFFLFLVLISVSA